MQNFWRPLHHHFGHQLWLLVAGLLLRKLALLVQQVGKH